MPTPRAAASGGPGGPGDQVVYDPAADLSALLLQPWVLVGRLISISWQLLALAVVLAVRGNSSDAAEQQRLGKRILTTLTNLGPCFIKVGQALSTRPDLVRRDWLEQLTQLQDNLPPFDHRIALATIEAELGAPVDQLFEDFPTAPMADWPPIRSTWFRPSTAGGWPSMATPRSPRGSPATRWPTVSRPRHRNS